MKKFLTALLAAMVLVLSTGCSLLLKVSGVESMVESGLEDAFSEVVSKIEEDLNSDISVVTSSVPESGSSDENSDVSSESSEESSSSKEDSSDITDEPEIDENGVYTSKEDVALYIRTYNKLPQNFITKKEAQALGWTGGSLEPYAEGKCIGGDRFGNYNGLLPAADGRKYTECDIDTLGAKSRGAKRIVFSNDGLIYYTDDHYESFTLLYGEELL